jgi:hypothetical protein
VVDDLGVGLVEAGAQVGFGGGQADGVADALAEGACVGKGWEMKRGEGGEQSR